VTSDEEIGACSHGFNKATKSIEKGMSSHHNRDCLQWRSQKFQLRDLVVFPLSLLSFALPFLFLSCFTPLFPSLRSRTPKIQLEGLGEHCELPHRVLGRSPNQNQTWCILTLKIRSGGNNFNYFPKNKLTKLANFVQFKRMVIFLSEDWGAGPSGSLLVYATDRLYG